MDSELFTVLVPSKRLLFWRGEANVTAEMIEVVAEYDTHLRNFSSRCFRNLLGLAKLHRSAPGHYVRRTCRLRQKRSFSENWICREFDAVRLISPNPEPLMKLAGKPKLTILNRLKNSARN